jgi:ABC-type multidrug transport system fused ATPase/permease subunit
MSFETVARQTLYRQVRARGGDLRSLADRKLLGRIWRFAGRHHRRLGAFVAVSVVSALLGLATPLLAGRVVDEIGRGALGVVVALAAVIAAIAVAEAGISLVTRWLSSNIGEGLILDLRTAVFDHVQRMPVAFFTRTRTGALVSRLGNDVTGAQRAFSDTFSGVITNIVTLTLTLVVMLRISWQVTLLSLLLMPPFLLPARWIGRTMARLSREAAIHNATMNTQMTERFSAPGATLVKLFGNPATESNEFEVRAGRVRDIGVRTSMLQSVFMNSLTLMSALALALVYGLGGVLAIGGHLQTGAIVSLALLLTRLYSPLTALANARVQIASALVSFERVFEVLDLVPLIQEKPGAVAVPGQEDGLPVSVEFNDVRFSYPSADKVSLASLEEVAVLDDRGGDEVLHGVSFTAQPGQMVALVGSSGLDTVVGERGYRLSGGQRQRLTIARLLLGRSRVVVLDEATASLDSASEAAVQQALTEALSGRTSIVIAHRLSTVRAADVILVVEDGHIVERGTHDQLMARGGRYAELYETQFGSQPDPEDVVAA